MPRNALRVLPCLLLVCGCAAVDPAHLPKPPVRLVSAGLQEATLRAATLRFEIEVSNPYPVAIPLADVEYTLASRGRVFLSGTGALQGTVAAKGKKTFQLPVTVPYAGLLETLADVRPGAVVPWEAEFSFRIEVPRLGDLRLPLAGKGELPVPAPPSVRVTEIRWNRLTVNEAGGLLRLRVANPNRFPVALKRLEYGLVLGGSKAASGAILNPVGFPAGGGEGEIEIPIAFSPVRAGLGLFQSLLGGSGGYVLTGGMEVETPYGPLRFPLSGEGTAAFSKSDAGR